MIGTDREPARRPRLPVAPLAPVASAVILGILADRANLIPAEAATWAVLALAGAAAAILAVRARLGPIALAGLLGAWVALGGGWHHAHWSDLRADDLARADWEIPRPAWVRGVLTDVPTFRPSPATRGEGTTRVALAVGSIRDGRGWRAASGRVQAIIPGDRTDLRAGRPVEAAGSLGAIPGPLNPGEFDYRAYLRAQGIRLRLAVDHPGGIWDAPGGPPSASLLDRIGRAWHRRLGEVRAWSHARLVGRIDPAAAPLAAALLLGRREGVDPEINDAFARTGTTHLLAISGLHLQALAGALWLACLALGVGRRRAFGLVALAAAGYALLVGLAPSVVRSAAMTVTVCIAGIVDRNPRPANLLAVAALATLAYNPSNAFDVGCQLSFLAVAAILWGVGPAGAWLRFAYERLSFRHKGPESPLDALERRLEPWWRAMTRRWRGLVVQGLVLSTVVWLAALPLVVHRFHVVAPIGILINVPLVPLMSLALLAAGLTLLGAAAWGPLAMAPAWACSKLLLLSESIVRWGASRPWGHAFGPGPPGWWVVGLYAGLALLILGRVRLPRGRRRRVGAAAFGAWVGLGVLLAARPDRPASTEADVLAVGHGLAVVVQGTDGRATLYDCGRMGDPSVGRRIIAPALWERGVRHLDRIVLSHADADHTNGLPDLLDRFSIGSVGVAPGFGDRDEASARLLDAVKARGIPVEELVAGDRWSPGPGATAEVLHPPAGWRPEAPDNDRSLVVDLSASGRHLLLTGDLDAIGQAALVERPSAGFDALLAPHHGGRSANPPSFHAWARPGLVVVSQQRPMPNARDPLAGLGGPDAPVRRTWERGAIRLRWSGSNLSARAFLDASGPGPGPRSPGASAVPTWARLAIGAAALALGLAFSLFRLVVEWGAWALVRPGRLPRGGGAEAEPWGRITVRAPDGTLLAGARRPAEGGGPAGRIALVLHGFAEKRAVMADRAEALAGHGWDVVLLDARGHGASEGDHASFGGREADDLRAWIDALAGPDATGAGPTLAIWGRSMGAAVALRAAAADPRVAALVLEAPYVDLATAVAAWLRRLRLPSALAGPMLRRAERLAGVPMARPRPIDLAPEVRATTLILHGVDDPVVSLADVRRLADALGGRSTLIEVDGARHVDVVAVGGAGLLDRVAATLDRATPRPEPDSES